MRPELTQLRPNRHAGGIVHQAYDHRRGEDTGIGVGNKVFTPIDGEFHPVSAMANIFHVEKPAMAKFAHHLVDEGGVKFSAFWHDAAQVGFAKRHLLTF